MAASIPPSVILSRPSATDASCAITSRPGSRSMRKEAA